jgi:hypothetical protein
MALFWSSRITDEGGFHIRVDLHRAHIDLTVSSNVQRRQAAERRHILVLLTDATPQDIDLQVASLLGQGLAIRLMALQRVQGPQEAHQETA